jgi:hypothetical protein
MKKNCAFFVLYFMLSCNAIKLINSEKVTTVKNNVDMIFVGKYLNLDVKVDTVNTSFLFDTGSSKSIILDTSVVENFTTKKKFNFGSSVAGDGKKIKNSLFAVSFNSVLFKSNNKVTTFINKPKNNCLLQKQSMKGIIGMDVFFYNNLSIFLDFTNNKISNIDEIDLNRIKNKYQMELIESECKNEKIFIFLYINGIKYKFKLDTGYNGNIIMPVNENLIINKENLSFVLDGSVFSTVSGSTNGSEFFYENISLKLGGLNLFSKLNLSSTIKRYNIGIEFIKSFDWLIDYNNNKIYIRKNQNILEKNYTERKNYYSKIINDKIVICVKERFQSKYNIGDIISSINEQIITPNNICEMQKLLKDTNDWNTINIEVIPVKK